MPVLKNEMVLQIDGFIQENPAVALRGRCKQFIGSRQWCTADIHYGDQEEPSESVEQTRKIWSITVALGLDHVPATDKDWFADVKALIEFMHPVARETDSEFIVEFRLSSKLWYSCTLHHLDHEPIDETDLTAIKLILENEIKTFQNRPWWRRIFGR
jgi:hypothetical protein